MTTVKTKTRTTKKGNVTDEENEYEIPESLMGLAERFLAPDKGTPDVNARLDAMARELARLYCDSWEYRDQQLAVERSRRVYRRLGLKHWSDEEEF